MKTSRRLTNLAIDIENVYPSKALPTAYLLLKLFSPLPQLKVNPAVLASSPTGMADRKSLTFPARNVPPLAGQL
jgi:hypothetical protein